MQIKSSAHIAQTNGVKCLIYGRAGMGKTSLVATAPAPLLISAESGLLSLRPQNLERMFGVQTPGISYDIPVVEIKTIQDLIEIERLLRTDASYQQFQTICIDSLSEIAEVVLANAKAQVKDKRQAYVELQEQIIMLVKAFRDLPGRNVYITAKEERIKDESTGISLAGPGMPGSKIGPALPYLFDEVFQLGKAKDPATNTEYRYLRTQPDFNSDAKDRSGMLAEIETPHLGYIFSKINGLI